MFKSPTLGKKVGWLEVVDTEYISEGRKSYYHCNCECGTAFKIRSDNFVKFVEGKTNSEVCLKCFHNYKSLPDETFKWIPDTRYAVSSDGRVWSGKRDKLLTPVKESFGYLVTKLGGDSKLLKIHRLVAEAFIPNPDGKPCVNHINGVKSDNNMENLEWVTYSENTIHAFNTGLTKSFGENHPKCKLSSEDVKFIIDSEQDATYLMNKFKVSRSTINRIIRGVIRKNG